MFVTATFHGPKKEAYASVPATAVLHLHDRDWVYQPAGGNNFRRLEVTGGRMLPGDKQEILAGLRPGQLLAATTPMANPNSQACPAPSEVVVNALDLQSTVEQ
jgi:hypothetical protein